MAILGARHFGAFVEPAGITLVEYQRARGGVRVLRVLDAIRPLTSIQQAAAALASLVEQSGAKRATVSVALRGFGSAHLTLTLPPASDDILRPIVYREVRRASPDLEEPVFVFNNAGSLERRATPRAQVGAPPVHLLVSAVPSGVDAALRDRLAESGITLNFLTVASHLLQRLYHELDGGRETTAVLLCLPGGPLVGYFVNGQLRMTMEAPVDAAGSMVNDLETVLERVERGSLYLRQQFRGAAPTRYLVSAPMGGFGELSSALRARTGVPALPFAGAFGSPSSVAAMGAVLDTIRPGGVNLVSYTPGLGERLAGAIRRRGALPTAVLAAGILAVAWAGLEVAQTRSTRAAIERATQALSRPDPMLARIRSTAGDRKTAAQAVASLATAQKAHLSLQEQLVDVTRALAPEVRLDSLSMSLRDDGWHAALGGRSLGATTAQAVRGLDSFYHGIPAQLDAKQLTLESLDYVADSTARQGVSVIFRLAFLLPGAPAR